MVEDTISKYDSLIVLSVNFETSNQQKNYRDSIRSAFISAVKKQRLKLFEYLPFEEISNTVLQKFQFGTHRRINTQYYRPIPVTYLFHCMYVCRNVRTNVCTYVRTYVCTYVRMYLCTYVLI